MFKWFWTIFSLGAPDWLSITQFAWFKTKAFGGLVYQESFAISRLKFKPQAFLKLHSKLYE